MALAFTSTADKAAGFARLTDLPGGVSVTGLGATVTLDATQSGNLISIDAASTVITLPTPQVGTTFTFVVTLAATSQKILTPAGVFMLGGLALLSGSSTPVPGAAAFNGTTHRSFTMNGSTAGGIVGSYFTLTAISTTQYVISGTLICSGTASVTPATS